MKTPKSYLIKIDRKTIKANENAGATKDYDYIGTTGWIKIRGTHESLEEMNDRIRMTGRSTSISSKKKYVSVTDYIVGGMDFKEMQELADTLRKKFNKDMLSFTIHNQYQEINFMNPVPPFSYQYKKTKVKCNYCDAKFTHDQLKSDSMEDDDNYSYSDKICPKCGEWECCQLEYEDIGGIILTKKGLPALVIR